MPNENAVAHNEVVLKGRKKAVPPKAWIKVFELFKLKRCRQCGRPLTSEKSIERGFGPTCGLEFANRWSKAHPKYVAPDVQKKWTREEINVLLQNAGAK